MPLTVLAPGLQTLTVNAGRTGLRSVGLPVGGAADRHSFRLAQALVGNHPDQTALEINFAGPTLRSEGRTNFVIVGAPFAVEIVGRGPVAMGESVAINDGEVLRISGSPFGARAYLAVPGGFGEQTKPLVINETLPTSGRSHSRRSIINEFRISQEPIRVMTGPQFDWFLRPQQFVGMSFQVAPASDRMGLRLRGNERLERKPGELVSEPVAPGAVQVTNDGHPVILGVDGQTIGGYPKIAHVIRADLDRIGQLRPGDTVRFCFVTPKEAEEANREAERLTAEWELRIAARS